MSSHPPEPGRAFALTDEQARFVAGPRSIVLAAVGQDQRSAIARGLGCAVLSDHQRLRLWVDTAQAAELLEALGTQPRLAVVFSEPPTHRTLQLKGQLLAIEGPADELGLKLATEHAEGFATVIGALGFPGDLALALVGPQPQRLGSLLFAADAAYEQSPGPRAGLRLA
jgi:hypothetical protein